jgi:hypothetical protein
LRRFSIIVVSLLSAAGTWGGVAIAASPARLQGRFSVRIVVTHARNIAGVGVGSTVVVHWSFKPGCRHGGCATKLTATVSGRKETIELVPSGGRYRATVSSSLACLRANRVVARRAYIAKATTSLKPTRVRHGKVVAFSGTAHLKTTLTAAGKNAHCGPASETTRFHSF